MNSKGLRQLSRSPFRFMEGEIGDCARFRACGLRGEIFLLLLCGQFKIPVANDIVAFEN